MFYEAKCHPEHANAAATSMTMALKNTELVTALAHGAEKNIEPKSYHSISRADGYERGDWTGRSSDVQARGETAAQWTLRQVCEARYAGRRVIFELQRRETPAGVQSGRCDAGIYQDLSPGIIRVLSAPQRAAALGRRRCAPLNPLAIRVGGSDRASGYEDTYHRIIHTEPNGHPQLSSQKYIEPKTQGLRFAA